MIPVLIGSAVAALIIWLVYRAARGSERRDRGGDDIHINGGSDRHREDGGWNGSHDGGGGDGGGGGGD